MNKDNAKDYLPLVQALAEGKTIQVLDEERKDWIDLKNATFAYRASDYRIKPETVTPYDALRVDDLVIVRDAEGSWSLRRFAGVSVKGKPLTWYGGACSATHSAVVEWSDCRLATPQEIEAARKSNMERVK